MTQSDSHPTGDTEREALATLAARFSADRDMLAAGIQRAELALRELGNRLEAVAARSTATAPPENVGALRLEMGKLAATVTSLQAEVAEMHRERAAHDDTAATATALMAVVDEMRVELRRVGIEIAEQAARHAERAAAGVAESSAEAHRLLAEALGYARAELMGGLEDVRRLAVASGERAMHALAQTTEIERRGRDLDTLRAALGSMRDEVLRRSEETEARFDVRLDSIVAGVEAEARAVRDALWNRVAGAEQRLSDTETTLAAVRAEMPQTAAQAVTGLATVHGALDELRDGLAATDVRLDSVEERQARGRGGLAGVLGCVRDELLAAVMAVVSVGAVVGRLTLSLVR